MQTHIVIAGFIIVVRYVVQYVIHDNPTGAVQPLNRAAVGDANPPVAIMLACKTVGERLIAR